MTTTIEKVARAIHQGCLYAPWDEMPEAARQDFLGHAQRAVAALRDPATEIEEAGSSYLQDAFENMPSRELASGTFKAMISAVLAEGK